MLRTAAALSCGPLLAIGAVCLTPLPPDLLEPEGGTTILLDRNGEKLAELPSTEARAHHPIPLGEMGPLPAITVALEDARFYQHWGIDIGATGAAFVRNIRAGRVLSGGSTITQQLIKLASGRTKRSWRAKLYENLAALRLEQIWPKDRILEEYLNRSHFGNRHVGPAAAAQAYFNKKPRNLTFVEATYLAGLPQAPSRFNPWQRPAAAAAKFHRSRAQLAGRGFSLTTESRRGAHPPALSPRAPQNRRAPHFVDALQQHRTRLPRGEVRTSLDLSLQRVAEQALATQLEKLAARQVRHGAVIIIDNATGAVRAMVGSGGYDIAGDGQINGALEFRSCGSTLKPFLYLRAINDRTLTAATLLPDTPDAVRAEYIDYDPVNYDRKFLGPVRVREALANSLNVPAVVTLSRMGARKAFRALEESGIKFARPFSDYGAGLILGNAEIRLLDLTAAFTVFAGRGLSVEPQLLPGGETRHRFVALPEAVSIVADILSDNDARRSTFGPFSPLAFENARIPCKTGTSSGFRDAWTVGTTAQHSVGVWMGNFDGRPMEEIASVTGPAPVWREIIDHLLAAGDSSVAAPVESPLLARRKVCRLTGLLPASTHAATDQEWFLEGTEPTETADRFWQWVDGRQQFVLPLEYALWCNGGRNRLNAVVAQTSPLQIVQPRRDATFMIDPHIPRAQQALHLVASVATADISWRVNGRDVPAATNGFFWPLTEGRHEVEVSTSGQTRTSSFTVE